MMKELSARQRVHMMNYLWYVVLTYREHMLPEDNPEHDEEWDTLCTMMHDLGEHLGYQVEVHT